MSEAMAILVVGLTISAVWRNEGMLYIVASLAWLVMAVYLANTIVAPAANPRLNLYVGVFACAPALVMAARALQVYTRGLVKLPSSTDRQAEHKKRVLQLTKRERQRDWFADQ